MKRRQAARGRDGRRPLLPLSLTLLASALCASALSAQTITAPTDIDYLPYRPFYYSPHADRVFASQPGRVTITWVSASPDTSAGAAGS